MSSLVELLSGYATEVEMRMRLQLDAYIRGSLVRSQLPQHWNFITEKERAFFSVDKTGKATVGNGSLPDPDVTIEWKHDLLCSVLERRSIEGLLPGEEPKVTIHTRGGKIGYAMIRRSLGFG